MSRTPTKKTRKVIDARDKSNTKKLNQKDLDSSCFRLSRVAQKYKSNRAVKQEEQRSFIDKYYSENPDAIDMRSPEEKLKEIDEKLQDENLEPHDRFLLLAQQKQLYNLQYGEDSPELMQNEIQLGIYYNEIGRPKSAIRHLTKAHQLEEVNEITEQDSTIIAVEQAEAYLTIYKKSKKQEDIRNLNRASGFLKQVAEYELEDKRLAFRRDLAVARLSAERGKNSEAIEQYEKAIALCSEVNGENSVETANIYCEMGQNADFAEEKEKSHDYYKKAYQIYNSLNMKAEAEELVPLFHTEEEEHPEEEQINQEENNTNQLTKNVNEVLTRLGVESEKVEDENSHQQESEISDDFVETGKLAEDQEKEEPKEENENGEGKAEQVISTIGGNLLG